MDAHLELVPGLGTLTVGGLAGGDVQGLGGQTDGALDLQGLGARTVNQLLAHLLERGNLARGEGDADLVDLLQRALAIAQIELRLRSSVRRKAASVRDRYKEKSGRTGPSPKSFSGFWKDILNVLRWV